MQSLFVLFVVFCVAAWPIRADEVTSGDEDQQIRQIIETAKRDGLAAAVQTAKELDLEQLQVRVDAEGHERYVIYSRNGRARMRRSKGNPNVYLLEGPDGFFFAWVRVNEDNAPRMTVLWNKQPSSFGFDLETLPDGSLRLMSYDVRSDFTEIYILTAESVTLGSMEEYLPLYIAHEAQRGAWGSMFDGVTGGGADESQDEPQEP